MKNQALLALAGILSVGFWGLVGAERVDAAPGAPKDAKKYLKQLAEKEWQAYLPPKGGEVTDVVVSFTLNADGTTSGITVKKHATNKGKVLPVTDGAAKLAIKNASPIPVAAEVFACPIELETTFDGRAVGKAVSCSVKSKDGKYSGETVNNCDY